MYDITYMWNLKNKTNKHKIKTELQIQKTNRWLPEMVWGGKKQMREIERYKFLVTKQMCHGYEIYSMGNIVNNYVIPMYGDISQLDLLQ